MSLEDCYFGFYDEILVDDSYDARQKRRAKKMVDNNKLKANKFYVGSNSVLQVRNRLGLGLGTWGHAEISDAIQHAQRVLDDTPDQEYVFIVEIVKVVRRQKHPVLIEDI